MSGATTGVASVTCTVCGKDAPLPMTAECNWCDQRYHLNQRNDVEAKDCGEVWIDEQFLALQFACSNCLVQEPDIVPVVRRPVTEANPAAEPRPARQRRYKRRA